MNESSRREVPEIAGTSGTITLEAEARPVSCPAVFSTVRNCWYHYYSYGSKRRMRVPTDIDFSLASYKRTPDFLRLLYNFEICHWQIGKAVRPGKSIVIVKTSVGSANATRDFMPTKPYVVGFFRVAAVQSGFITMDPDESLLLLSNPIEITLEMAKQLFPSKQADYWERSSPSFAAKVGSITRNKYLETFQTEFLVKELVKRKNEGAANYLGPRYGQLLRRREPLTLKNWMT